MIVDDGKLTCRDHARLIVLQVLIQKSRDGNSCALAELDVRAPGIARAIRTRNRMLMEFRIQERMALRVARPERLFEITEA